MRCTEPAADACDDVCVSVVVLRFCLCRVSSLMFAITAAAFSARTACAVGRGESSENTRQ